MAKVPEYDGFKVMPTGSPGERLSTSVINADQEKMGLEQLEKLGNAQQKLGDTLVDINVQELDEANQLRVDEALNEARQQALDLTYNPDTGYVNLKGGAALNRPDGKALPEEYTGKFQKGLDDISGKLGNEAQRRAFKMRANDLSVNLQGDAQRHMLGEFTSHKASVAAGSVKLSAQEAAANWYDPGKVDQAINGSVDPITGLRSGGIKETVFNQRISEGKSAEEAKFDAEAAVSGVHTQTIESALSNGNATYASKYFNAYHKDMNANDVLQVQGKIQKKVNDYVAAKAVNDTTAKYSSTFAPNDLSRLEYLVRDKESRHRDYDDKGNVLTSEAGARYAMQVMPQTAVKPGYGIKPAQNDTPEEYNRVGRELLVALVKEYGGLDKALAAYNAGGGTVNKALASAKAAGEPANWREHMRKFQSAKNFEQTKDYVDTITKKFGVGGGTEPLPTIGEFVNDAVGRLGENANPEASALARQQAEQQYDLLVKSRKQQEDTAVTDAMRSVLENGGSYKDIPFEVRSRIPAAEVGKVMEFAGKVSKGDDRTSELLYQKLESDPAYLKSLSDGEFYKLRMELSETDFKYFTKQRAGQVTNGPDELNSTAIKSALDDRLRMIGVDPSPKEDDTAGNGRAGAIRKFVNDSIFLSQRQSGKKMTDAEVSQFIDTLFAKTSTYDNWLGDGTGPMLGMTAKQIPDSYYNSLKASFKRKGIDATDAQLLDAYWRGITLTRK